MLLNGQHKRNDVEIDDHAENETKRQQCQAEQKVRRWTRRDDTRRQTTGTDAQKTPPSSSYLNLLIFPGLPSFPGQ
jgi:hypothetical protein